MDRQQAALSSLEKTIESLNRVDSQLQDLKKSMDSARDQLRVQAQLRQQSSEQSIHDEN
jgi:hypothetical protein